MAPRNFFSKHLLRRAEDLIKGENVLENIQLLEDAISWNKNRIENFQLTRLQKLIIHSYENVPYYRLCLEQKGLSPLDINSLDDLKKIPILTRDNLRENFNGLLRSRIHDFSKCKMGSSSGSTGDPIKYFQDKKAVSAGRAANIFGWSLAGKRLGDGTVVVWGNYNTVKHEWSKTGSRIKAKLFCETRIPAYKLANKIAMDNALFTILNSNKPFLYGYTNAIFALALLAKEKNIVKNKFFRGVLTTAENLSEETRKVIESVFGPVYDGYGSGEILGIAFQCQEKKEYHIIEPFVIVEFEDIGLGDEKALLLTDLTNYAMPLIRYQIGDIGVQSSGNCSCGRPWATINRISGRTNDLFKLPNGGTLLIPSVFGSSLLKTVDGIANYQLAIISDDHVSLRIVPINQLSKQDIEKINKSIISNIGDEIQFSIQQVQHIQIGQSGKHKLVVDERHNHK